MSAAEARLRSVISKKSNPTTPGRVQSQSVASRSDISSSRSRGTAEETAGLDTRPRLVRSAHLLNRVCVQHTAKDDTEEVVTPVRGVWRG